ncbi:MAG: hypothetical protein Q8N21_03930 [bacterium]|nr:hypothetical protein [bacterium]
MNDYTEDNLVEQPAIKIFQDQLGYSFINGFNEKFTGQLDLSDEKQPQGGKRGAKAV